MNHQGILQPALLDSSEEFFSNMNSDHKLCNGSVNHVQLLPYHFTLLLKQKLSADKPAQKGLDILGITNEPDRVQKYYDCNYSAFDKHPDICLQGMLGPVEYVSCLYRGSCEAESKLCKNPCGLSNREMEIAKRISLGQQDMQITMELFIAQDTLRNHKNNIETKIGKKGKPAIAAWYVKFTQI